MVRSRAVVQTGRKTGHNQNRTFGAPHQLWQWKLTDWHCTEGRKSGGGIVPGETEICAMTLMEDAVQEDQIDHRPVERVCIPLRIYRHDYLLSIILPALTLSPPFTGDFQSDRGSLGSEFTYRSVEMTESPRPGEYFDPPPGYVRREICDIFLISYQETQSRSVASILWRS